MNGSSPLTRGKQIVGLDQVAPERLIPAHAGKTTPKKTHCSRRWAHPRSRGENGNGMDTGQRRLGSSPLTRGKQGVRGHCGGSGRLIPAHAGKTWCASSYPQRSRAHPRSRGENVVACGGTHGQGGSSPLTRGKRPLPSREGAGGRLIPAHAGKTRTGTSPPRSTCGSSPLTRGKLGCPLRTNQSSRLIPAHAGKTWSPRAAW